MKAEGDSPLERGIRFHLIDFIVALRHGRQSEAALHHQKCSALLEQYARSADTSDQPDEPPPSAA
jgi:hypothetical protein